jgi:hypothetical protein
VLVLVHKHFDEMTNEEIADALLSDKQFREKVATIILAGCERLFLSKYGYSEIPA